MFLKYLSISIKKIWSKCMESKGDVLIIFSLSIYATAIIILIVTNIYPKLLTILMIPFITFIVIVCILMVGVILLSFILAMCSGFKKQIKQYKRWKEVYQRENKK